MSASLPMPGGPWQDLFRQALTLIDEIRTHGTANPFWTFGAFHYTQVGMSGL